jgi:ATP/maltotriose-dependent transcriptional regulator MalT
LGLYGLIAQIRQDKLNTENSDINNQLNKNQDPEEDLENAMRALNKVDSKDKYLKIMTYSTLGEISFTLYELPSVKDNLSTAIFFL